MKSVDNKEKVEDSIIELSTRVNFKFSVEKHQPLASYDVDQDIVIVSVNGQMFQDMQGSVVPKYFWDDEADFLKNGIAFGLI